MEGFIKVMLVEDDEFWQKQLALDLNKEEDIQVVKIAATKLEALNSLDSIEIDVVLMDINLTENKLDGLEAAKEITRIKGLKPKVIMLTSLSEQEVIVKAFQNGAVNYITKSNFHDIVKAVRDAYADKSSIHCDAASAMRNELHLMQLSPSEREIYDLREKGFNKTQMSEILHKSVNTIKTQLRSIRDKLQ
ncbi:response regulator transcription factor [Neobacillus cucumis]|uniref:response regulator transcription factor n=1 Tax=Neobacillus cucumis TaxID=1740721 RepID=UPI001966A2D9|nr:response regulator transcription factor [Neobacillus cucumis]MBM7652799.1 DNA-binding NarL/FixJ family response regulator [Neobacillus cucumis]MED4229353.1 response regulator transcription factor [Neobacillus cucumis]